MANHASKVAAKCEIAIRQRRANVFAIAARDCHPDDAAQLATALLIDLSAGMPKLPYFTSIRDDARWWASLATPAELLEALSAALKSLNSTALHGAMRKRLFMSLWHSFSPFEQGNFLARVADEVRP